MENLYLINSISLITSFAGGIVALFAPCCITFLLPSYLANIFRNKANVLFMTLVFGLGIATVLVPTALGIRAIGQLFQQFHTQTYLAGSIFMILLGIMEITGKKFTLPMLHLTIDLNTHRNPWAVYVLGVFSGVTSSCCTPVLAGVLTLSFLSPTFFWAGLAGLSYVFGMVVPLTILAVLLDKINWKNLPQFRNKTMGLAGNQILVSDAVAGVLYISVGIIFSLLAMTGKIAMGTTESVEQTLGLGVMNFIRVIRAFPGSEYLFAFLLIAAFITILRKGGKR